ncbi:MAG: dCTP deaminase [Bacillota bacterium]
MLLNKNEIMEYINLYKLITPIKDKRLQSCSYDLSLGDEYYVYNKKHGNQPVVSPISKYESICIPQNGVCFIITEETLNMPYDVSGQISLSFGLIKKGVMLSNQPPIDPGYNGKIVALLHNLSSEPVYIQKGKHVLTIVFYKVNETTGYEGSYQHLESIKRYIDAPVKSSLFQLSNEITSMKRTAESFNRFLITIILIILGILTINPFFLNEESIKSDIKKELLKELTTTRMF